MRIFTLTLDDYSPRKGTNNLYWADKLIENYPNIKINLFVSAAYCRLGEEPQYLSKHSDWVTQANNLPENYRICMHGMFHRRTEPGHTKSNNDEFQFLDSLAAKEKVEKMVNEFEASGINYSRTFRAPGWKISKEAVIALQKYARITCFAGSEEYWKKVKDVLKAKWINYNWDMTGPCAVKENIVAIGHTSNWTNNYMNEERYRLIMQLLKKKQFGFRFVEDM